MSNRPDRRDVLKAIGASGIAATVAIQVYADGRNGSSNEEEKISANDVQISTERRIQTTEVLLKGTVDSPLTADEIVEAQEETLVARSGEFDLAKPRPSESDTVVAYSHTLRDDGVPEVYTGMIGGSEDVTVSSADTAKMHEKAEKNVENTLHKERSFVDSDEEWNQRLRALYETTACPYGTIETVAETWKRHDLDYENRGFWVRNNTYTGETECGAPEDELPYWNDFVRTKHDWSDTDPGTETPFISDRDAEVGDQGESGALSVSINPSGMSVPLSGPPTGKRDLSSSEYAKWRWGFGKDYQQEYTHSAGSVAEWEVPTFQCGDTYLTSQNQYDVLQCGALVPIFTCGWKKDTETIGHEYEYYCTE